MSSFNNLFNRMESLNEAKVSPVGRQAPVFKDVPKQMKAAGMAASSRDAMIFITQVLSRLDIITPEVYGSTIKGQHKERMDKLMAILKNHEEDINAKEGDIVKFINDNLDNYTSGAGTDRNRTEKYKETAKKISKEVSNIAAGKEADDGLRDILYFVNDTMQDMDIQRSDDDTPETGPVRAAVDSVMAGLRKESQADPDSIPPYIIEDLEEFVPKIMTLEQYKSFVQQLAEFSKEDQYYQKPVIHFMDSVKAVEAGIARNVAEDGEYANRYTQQGEYESTETVGFEELGLNRAVADSLNADGGGESFYRAVNPNLDIGSLKKLIANREARMKLPGMRDIGMSGQLARMLKQISGLDDAVVVSFAKTKRIAPEDGEENYAANQSVLGEINKIAALNTDEYDGERRSHSFIDAAKQVYFKYKRRDDKIRMAAAAKFIDVEDAEDSIKAEVLTACTELAGDEATNSEMASACEVMYNKYGLDGDQERAEIALSLYNDFKTEAKREEAEENLTLESIYDVMGFQEIKAPLMDENGVTSSNCSTVDYLTEAVEQEIEKAGLLYTEGYLTEQKTTDSYIKSKPEPGQTFKERYKPKTNLQLEELRRYGL